jgi:hypothetical protein
MRIRAMACGLLTAAVVAGGPALADGKGMGSQTTIEALVSEDGGDLVANTVAFESTGGPALVRWSLSYEARKATSGGKEGLETTARLDLRARLLRGDEPLVEWPLDFAETLQTTNAASGARIRRQGTASALHIDQPPPGLHEYRLVIWDAGGRVLHGRSWLRISARTLLVEPR